jgi:hypothetical protein
MSGRVTYSPLESDWFSKLLTPSPQNIFSTARCLSVQPTFLKLFRSSTDPLAEPPTRTMASNNIGSLDSFLGSFSALSEGVRSQVRDHFRREPPETSEEAYIYPPHILSPIAEEDFVAGGLTPNAHTFEKVSNAICAFVGHREELSSKQREGIQHFKYQGSW